jgi:hypothetical protein
VRKSRARRQCIETTFTFVEIDYKPCRLPVAAFEGLKIAIAEGQHLLVQGKFAGPPQEIYTGRLNRLAIGTALRVATARHA